MIRNNEIQVGGKSIGFGEPVYIVVELGVCHEQNIELAMRFIEAAKTYGADAVKIEAFRADNFVIDKTLMHQYGTAEGIIEENYYDLLKRLELTFDQIKMLKNKADEVGITFFSTVHDKEDVEFFEELGVDAYKIASVDMTHTPLIDCLLSIGKPVFMDTGAAYLDEIDTSIRLFDSANFNKLILMHNPTGYPAPPEKTDLRLINTLQSAFDIPVGLSCHTPGFDMVVAAVAIGANVIEKPISRDRNLRSPEHVFSFEIEDTGLFVKKIRNTEICLGKKRRTFIDEKSHGRAKRRGIYSRKDLKKGHVLTEDDFLYRVPNKGIATQYYRSLVGKKLTKSYLKGEPFKLQDIDE